MHPEQEDKDGRHQRPAADAGNADQHADNKAGKRIERLKSLGKIHATDLDARTVILSNFTVAMPRLELGPRRRLRMKSRQAQRGGQTA
jgi:hypothetical protein